MTETKPKIEVRHTSIIINDYELHDSEVLENSLSIYDPIKHKRIFRGLEWDNETKTLYLPRGVDINFLEKIFSTQAVMNYESDPYEPLSIRSKVPPRDDDQRKSIAFLIGAEPFTYTQKYSQLLLNLPTGAGKTYVVTTALQFIGQKAIIIVPNEKLKRQVISTFLTKTDLGKEFIIDIRGKSEINKIMKKPNPKYKIYVACHGTLISHAGRNGWESIENLFKHMGVGVKIYDEAHLFFDNILKIDFHTNTRKTIYMTATFKRSDFAENALFNKCFKNVVRYGAEAKEHRRKHVMYLSLQYDSKPSLGQQTYMVTNMGFNKMRYADYQIKQDEFFNALKYAVEYFKKYDGKMLVLTSTIEAVETIRNYLNENFKDISITSYHSKLSEEERDKAFEADIICTTPKSAGVGTDIPGLRVVMMCESYSSEVQAEQISGRLREFSDEDDTYYVELVDVGFPKVYKMWKNRLNFFKKICKKMLNVDLTKKKVEEKEND